MNIKVANEIELLISEVKKRKKARGTKKPFSIDFKQTAIRAWKESGLSKNKFANTIGVSDSLIYNWNKQYGNENNVVTKSTEKVVTVGTVTKLLLGAVHGYLSDYEAGIERDVVTGTTNLECADALIQLLIKERKGDANTVHT